VTKIVVGHWLPQQACGQAAGVRAVSAVQPMPRPHVLRRRVGLPARRWNARSANRQADPTLRRTGCGLCEHGYVKRRLPCDQNESPFGHTLIACLRVRFTIAGQTESRVERLSRTSGNVDA
jgi:hypothetical protein